MVVRPTFAVLGAVVTLTLLQASCASSTGSSPDNTGDDGGAGGSTSSGGNAASSGGGNTASSSGSTASSGGGNTGSSSGTTASSSGIVVGGGDGGTPGNPMPVPTPPPNNRTVFNFDYGWKFMKMDVAGASGTGFNDSTWTAVSLPHTFNDIDQWVDWVSFGNDTPIVRPYEGLSWYRRHFTLTGPSYAAGRKVFLEFQGARDMGTFYVNGKSLGFCEDEISPCGIDITSAVQMGDNVVAVQINNNDLEKDQTYVPGYVFDWSTTSFYPMFGGLYTDVNLIITDPIHQTLPLWRNLQTQGVYVYPTNIDTLAKSATVTVESEVYNESANAQPVTLSVDIYDNGGNKVTTFAGTATMVAAGMKTVLKASTAMTGVHFWAPDYPYLYTARSSITVGGNVLDVTDNPLGIRKLSWSATNGMKWNGHSYWVPGFAPREVMDWPGTGIPQDWMTEYDYLLMKQANHFFIRPMHVAPRKHMVESADRLGIVMVVPAGDGEGCYSMPDWPQHPAVMQNVMIYFRNNPSVTYYEGCNSPLTTSQLADMKAKRDMWDPHGGRYVGARDTNQTIPYEYGSPMDGTGRSTTWPIWSAEYSREESPRRVWDKYTPAWDPKTSSYVTGGYVKIAASYYMGTLETAAGNYIAEYPLCDFRQNSMEDKTLCNIFKYWQGYAYSNFVEDPATRTTSGIQIGAARIIWADSKTDGRMKDTDVSRLGGAVDGARLPKEDFYALRVAASLTPDITILGHWNYPAGTTKTMYVIASCGQGGATPSTVTLGSYQADGKTLIKSYTGAIDMQMGSPNHYVWNFPNVAFQPGVLKATATCGSTMVSDQKVTTGPVAALKLTPVLGPQGWFADGADIAMIDVEAVDANGLRVPTDEANVTFTHSGAGQWIGGYNSGVRQSLFKDNLWTEGGINRLFVRSTTTAGTFTVTATRTGLPPQTITLTSTAFPIDANGLTTAWSQRYHVVLGTEPTPIADPN